MIHRSGRLSDTLAYPDLGGTSSPSARQPQGQDVTGFSSRGEQGLSSLQECNSGLGMKPHGLGFGQGPQDRAPQEGWWTSEWLVWTGREVGSVTLDHGLSLGTLGDVAEPVSE